MEEAKILLADIIKDLAKRAASSLVKKTKDYLVDMSKKEEIDIGDAYEEYLRKVYATYSKSKTILYGDESRELSSFFVPVDLAQGEGFGDNVKYEKISTKDIVDVFEKRDKLIVTGIGGMGKTMLMKHFCSSAIIKGYKIPIFISLRRFNNVNIDNKPIEALIYDQLETLGFKLEYKYFEYSLRGDRYLFLFDGYDELSNLKRADFSFRLVDFARRYSDNIYVISSRQIDEIFSLEEFSIWSICPMRREQTVQLIWKLDFDYEMKKRFIDELTDRIYDQYESFASVPLLLSILFLTYISYTKLPESLNDFYEKAFETLLFKHDRMKIGFERIFYSKLTYEEYRKVFLCFCFITYFKEKFFFSYRSLANILSDVSNKLKIDFDEDAYIKDLVFTTCMLIRDGQEYIFLHRSFQVYFAAVFVSKKNDFEQSKLCSSFLNYDYNTDLLRSGKGSTLAMVYSSFHSSLLKKKYGISYGGDFHSDFLKMLQSVEPERFEGIVLVPIMEKINTIYQETNKDLLRTMIWCSQGPTLWDPQAVHIDTDVNISLREFSVLRDYYDTRDNASLEIVKSYGDLAEQVNQPISREKYRDKGGRLLLSLFDEHFSQAFNNMFYSQMWVTALSIAKYNNIKNQNMQNKSFIMSLEDFI